MKFACLLLLAVIHLAQASRPAPPSRPPPERPAPPSRPPPKTPLVPSASRVSLLTSKFSSVSTGSDSMSRQYGPFSTSGHAQKHEGKSTASAFSPPARKPPPVPAKKPVEDPNSVEAYDADTAKRHALVTISQARATAIGLDPFAQAPSNGRAVVAEPILMKAVRTLVAIGQRHLKPLKEFDDAFDYGKGHMFTQADLEWLVREYGAAKMCYAYLMGKLVNRVPQEWYARSEYVREELQKFGYDLRMWESHISWRFDSKEWRWLEAIEQLTHEEVTKPLPQRVVQ